MIVQLGYHCNVTFVTDALKLRKETTLFEYFESRKLGYITEIINNISEKIDPNIITGKDNIIYLLNRFYYSGHYEVEEYKEIFCRRVERFLDLIKKSNLVYFSRINPLNCNTSLEEIIDFSNAIKNINPNIQIKFLLIDTINEPEIKLDVNIENFTLYHKFFLYDDCKDDVYLKDNKKIHLLFYEYLIEMGAVEE